MEDICRTEREKNAMSTFIEKTREIDEDLVLDDTRVSIITDCVYLGMVIITELSNY